MAFLGNVFSPMSGLMLDVGRLTPLYGYAALARYPLTERMILEYVKLGKGLECGHRVGARDQRAALRHEIIVLRPSMRSTAGTSAPHGHRSVVQRAISPVR